MSVGFADDFCLVLECVEWFCSGRLRFRNCLESVFGLFLVVFKEREERERERRGCRGGDFWAQATNSIFFELQEGQVLVFHHIQQMGLSMFLG